MLGIVPGMRVAAPRDAATLREELAEAVAVARRPDRDPVPEGRGDRVGAGAAAGRTGSTCCTSQRRPARPTVRCCWCAPARSASWGWPRRSGWPGRGSRSPSSTRAGCCRCRRRSSSWPAGTGSWSPSPTAGGTAASAPRWPTRCAAAECDVPVRDMALPQRFLDHGSRDDVLAEVGLTAQGVARRVTEWAAGAPRCGARPVIRTGPTTRPPANRCADAGADRRGRAAAGRRGRPRAAPRGHGGRRRLRRRHRAREVRGHPLRRGGARPRPARDVRRPAVRRDRRVRGAPPGC